MLCNLPVSRCTRRLRYQDESVHGRSRSRNESKVWAASEREVAERRHLRLQTLRLACCELVHARIVGIVHVVVCAAKRDEWCRFRGVREDRHARTGSSPVLLQVSRFVGQPKAGVSSAGVSLTWSPEPVQPPWKVW